MNGSFKQLNKLVIYHQNVQYIKNKIDIIDNIVAEHGYGIAVSSGMVVRIIK